MIAILSYCWWLLSTYKMVDHTYSSIIICLIFMLTCRAVIVFNIELKAPHAISIQIYSIEMSPSEFLIVSARSRHRRFPGRLIAPSATDRHPHYRHPATLSTIWWEDLEACGLWAPWRCERRPVRPTARNESERQTELGESFQRFHVAK